MICLAMTLVLLWAGGQSCQFSDTFDPCSDENHSPFPYMPDRCPDCEYLSNDRNDLYDLDHDKWYITVFNMSTTYVPPNSCGTLLPIWMNGTIPLLGEGVVNRTTCVATYEKFCATLYSIKVKRCDMFNTVYCLDHLPNNQQRFCFDIPMTTSTAKSETAYMTLSMISSSTKPSTVLPPSTEVIGETRTSIKVPATIRSTTSLTTASARQTIEPSSRQSISTKIKPVDYLSRDKEEGIQTWVIVIIAGLFASIVILVVVIIAMKRRLTKRKDDNDYDVPEVMYVNDNQPNVYATLDLPPLASREVSSSISGESERYVTMNYISTK